MVIEAEAIPYSPSHLRGERMLVLAPHPDDEVIGCGGLLGLHLHEGRQVRILVATDGLAAEPAANPDSYRTQREEESRRGLAILTAGVSGRTPSAPVIEFLRLPDRRLEEHEDSLRDRLAVVLREFQPDLIAVPSAIEIHPDHLALSEIFHGLIQSDPDLWSTLALTRVAFYEVGQPLRPNALVDITAVAEEKYAAIEAHRSQSALRDYSAFSRGLNAYRAMTLGPEVTHAEAYCVLPLPELRTTAFSALRDLTGNVRQTSQAIRMGAETVPISVIVRTKNRLPFLAEALASIRSTGYPAEIVVVNDGGERPSADGVTLINNERSLGRSEAMNLGVRAARSAFIAFLDDDDLFYPEHLQTLASCATTTSHVLCYSDAVSAFLTLGDSGVYETTGRMRIFSEDYDRSLLLMDNYIPLPTILVTRDRYLESGGFNPELDLFEDWDFLIRMSRRGQFQHVPRVTCEIRHIHGGDSITLRSPVGSAAFRNARLEIWKRHADLIDNDVIADAFESQKRKTSRMSEELTNARGKWHHHEMDLSRLERDKQTLIDQNQQSHLALQENERQIAALYGGNASLQAALDRIFAESSDLRSEAAALRARVPHFEKESAEQHTTITALYAEIQRLQSLLDEIFGSKTWRLHKIVERMKGRG